jgi:predicted deacylase
MRFSDFMQSPEIAYDNYVSRLVNCSPRVVTSKLCDDGLPVYRATVNPDVDPCIFIVGGIHGNERGGIHGMLDYLSSGDFPKSIRLEFFPVINTSGFLVDTRKSIDGRDMNRDMCSEKPSIPVRSLLKAVAKMRPMLFVTMHEDDSVDKFYMYNSDETMRPLWDDIVRMAGESFGIASGDIHGDICISGIISHPSAKRIASEPKHGCSIENAVHDMGCPYATIETPMSFPMARRSLMAKKIIERIVRAYS